jgi:hypothetical protein
MDNNFNYNFNQIHILIKLITTKNNFVKLIFFITQ